MIDELPHFSLQSEERVHDILLANLDYQYNSGSGKWSLISYFAMQNAKRDHYTGIRPEINSSADTLHLINPPYGFSDSQTKQIGLQLSRKLDFLGTNVVTFGADLMNDAVIDEIEVYDYKINQNISTLAFFVQSDWNNMRIM